MIRKFNLVFLLLLVVFSVGCSAPSASSDVVLDTQSTTVQSESTSTPIATPEETDNGQVVRTSYDIAADNTRVFCNESDSALQLEQIVLEDGTEQFQLVVLFVAFAGDILEPHNEGYALYTPSTNQLEVRICVNGVQDGEVIEFTYDTGIQEITYGTRHDVSTEKYPEANLLQLAQYLVAIISENQMLFEEVYDGFDAQIFVDNPTRYDTEAFYDLMMETPFVLNDTEILLNQTPFSALSQSDWIILEQDELSGDVEANGSSFQTLMLQRTETQTSWKDPVDGTPYCIGLALFNEGNTVIPQSDTSIAGVTFLNIPSLYRSALADDDTGDIGPTITILGAITPTSTLEDVVAVLGSPMGIWYGNCHWTGSNEEGDHVSLILQFADDGTIETLTLTYSHHMFNQ